MEETERAVRRLSFCRSPKGLLEMMGLVDEEKIGDSVEGYLTAKDIFDRIYADHFGTAKE